MELGNCLEKAQHNLLSKPDVYTSADHHKYRSLVLCMSLQASFGPAGNYIDCISADSHSLTFIDVYAMLAPYILEEQSPSTSFTTVVHVTLYNHGWHHAQKVNTREHKYLVVSITCPSLSDATGCFIFSRQVKS